ncbi:lipopolysaccharide biosynthesis protein [Clostridium mediterraneense]|uniref:lipopolysaccharide biosynthesis protein n=1 Tax=Clostridium mediterraneense TaxID=1805472 RepID=UPI0008369E6C|nr:oligosaccharide flippase family protein [Clostridium mediterraneense]
MYKKIKAIKENKLVKNFIVLLTGEGISSILSMLSVILIVKAIGLEGNGMILSIQAYCLLLTSIFGFKSFQALIKYISKEIQKENFEKVKNYIKQSYFLDIVAAVITMIVSFIFVNLYSKFMGWNNELLRYSYMFIVATVFQIQGTPIGILRIFDKFNYITYNNVIVSVLRVIFYLIGIFMGLKLNYFMYIELFLYVLPNITLNYLSYRTLKENKLQDFYKVKFKIDKNFFKFNFYSNISSTIDIPISHLTTIMINKYLGYSEISIYKIFEKIGSLIGKIGSPIGQIIYPELTEKISKKEYKKAKNMSDKLMYYIGGAGIVLTIFAYLTHKLWLWIFITDYGDYIYPLIIYLLFTVFINCTVGVHNLFLALNYIKYTIPILTIVNLVYLIIMYILITQIGLSGVIISLFLQAVIIVALKIIIMKKNSYEENKN